MTLNLMPLVILFGLALLLAGRTNDQQTQQKRYEHEHMRSGDSGFSTRRSGLPTNQPCSADCRGGAQAAA
jgi:hypothetical protein